MNAYNQPGGFSILPVVVKNLLIINGLAFLATIVLADRYGFDMLRELGIYVITSPNFEVYQVVTHMFLHAGFGHLFFNMFALWMFGSIIENVLGPKRFLIYYFATGLGAAFLHMVVNLIHISYADPQTAQMLLQIPAVGASGAVFGLLLAYGMMFPNNHVYLFMLMPIKAKYFVIGYGLIELYLGLSMPGSNIAHFAHLGGMLFGFLLLRYWKKRR